MINTTLLVLPIFIVVFLGFVLRRYDIITEEYIKVSNRLVFIIFLPALLFVEISKTSFLNDPYGKLFAVMFFSVCIIFLLSIIIGRIIKMDKKTIGTFAMNNFRANYAYMGLPVVFYAYGQTGLSIGSILMAFIVPFVNLLSVVSLTMGCGSESRKPLYLLKSTLVNPIAMACIIGLLFSIFKIQLPLFLLKSLDIVSKVALPMALLGIGATINFRYISGNKLYLFVNAFMKLLLLP
ncbi:MAG: AEC family transporter, partial [Deferribacterales bacterium]